MINIFARHTDIKPIRTSRNLRGILDYARKEPVIFISLQRINKNSQWNPARSGREAILTVRFYDGATSSAEFCSFTVAREWVNSRHSWGLPISISESDNYIEWRYL